MVDWRERQEQHKAKLFCSVLCSVLTKMSHLHFLLIPITHAPTELISPSYSAMELVLDVRIGTSVDSGQAHSKDRLPFFKEMLSVIKKID